MAMLKLDFMKLFSSAFFTTSTNWKESGEFSLLPYVLRAERLPSRPPLPDNLHKAAQSHSHPPTPLLSLLREPLPRRSFIPPDSCCTELLTVPVHLHSLHLESPFLLTWQDITPLTSFSKTPPRQDI